MSSRDLGNLHIFVLGCPRSDDVLLVGDPDHPTAVDQVIDDLASPLVGLLVVVKGSIGLDDTVTELTEADDELAAVAVAHTTIIGQVAQDLKRNLKKFEQRRVLGALALLSLSIIYYRPDANINVEKPPENIALMGLLG